MGDTHELKIWPAPFHDMQRCVKTFEFRKNDRDYKVGDHLRLREWDPEKKDYTGAILWRLVTYILPGGSFGLPEDYVIMSVVP